MKYLNAFIIITALIITGFLINSIPAALNPFLLLLSVVALCIVMRLAIEGSGIFRQFAVDNSGLSALEYIVVAAILTAMVLTALWNIAHSLQVKLEDVNNNL